MSRLFKRLDSEKREITAPVMVPDEVDYHGDTCSEEEVFKACRNYQEHCGIANLQHSSNLTKDDAHFVEHYLTPTDMTFEDSDVKVKKGTWLATMKVTSDSLWEDVKDGKFTGFSIGANGKARELTKTRVAGSAAADEGIQVKRRLSDIDFSSVDHHVALVDEAANATTVLVLKAKNKNKEDNTMSKPEDSAAQEALMKKNVEEEVQAEQLQKAKDEELESLRKEKADNKVELETLRKEKEEADKNKVELEDLKKAKDQADTEVLVKKAKELKTDEPEVFGLILKKCKSALDEKEYEVLEKQLEKLENITKANDDGTFDKLGDSETEELKKSKDDRISALRKKFINEDKLDAPTASKRARLEVEDEDRKASSK